jgi:SAM-dependent methyltransferase
MTNAMTVTGEIQPMNRAQEPEGHSRLNPRLWQTNWYVMRCLKRVLQQLIVEHIKEGVLLVDYGCGSRPYEPLFLDRKAKYVGVDVGDNPLADLIVHPGGNQRVDLPDESADAVLSSQVLEHVIDVDAYLDECSRLLRPEGILLLSTHGCWTYHPYPTDVRRWTCWGLKHEIEKHGFQVIAQKGCVGPLAYTTQLRLQLLGGALNRLGRITAPLIGVSSVVAQTLMIVEDWLTPREIREQNSAVYVLAARRVRPTMEPSSPVDLKG